MYILSLVGARFKGRSGSSRVLFASWFLTCLILVATYTGNLMAILTVFTTAPPFDNLEELVARTTYKFGTLGGTAQKQIFEVNVSFEWKFNEF